MTETALDRAVQRLCDDRDQRTARALGDVRQTHLRWYDV